MSALAGRWNFDGRPDADRDCTRMLATQAVYGPHDGAQWDAGAISIGRRLFRLLPEDIHDAQPLTGGDGRFALVADLRLDNRDELIAELAITPDRARVMADSAILLRAWERWQDEIFAHIAGDYAFALFDRREQRLVLARDHAGGRPLHYHVSGSFVAFASMPKGLHALAEIPRQPNQERVAEQLVLLPESGSETFFKDVERVQGGCVVAITPKGLTTRRHWQPARTELRLSSPDQYAEALVEHLDRAVRVRLRGAGSAVGAHLSAGFDSSSVTASAATVMAPSNGKVFAFTSMPREGFTGKAPRGRFGDEGIAAAITAARYPNIEHVPVRTAGRTPLDNLDRNFFLYERPVLNLCNMVWAHAINDAARERGLNVLLTGQFGNMTISYDGITRLPTLVRQGHMLSWLRESVGLIRSRNQGWRNVLAQSFGPYMPVGLWNWINETFRGVSNDPSTYTAIRPEMMAEMDMETRARERALDVHYRPRVDGFETRLWVLSRVDLGNYVKGTLGGWGLDQRDPTGDKRLFEFCLSVPEEQFLRDGQTKALARRAFAARLPPEVIQARGKGYQAVDWYEGVIAARGAANEEIERLEDCTPAAATIDLSRLKQLMADMPADGWDSELVMRKYRLTLLRAISTGHFLRRATGSNR